MGLNFRSKTTAMILAFFLGVFGAHWFYLGKRDWGMLYLVVSLGAWPIALMMGMAFAMTPGFGAIALVLAWGAQVVVALATLYDFCCLLCMEPTRFDLEYNP
jgi:TM2 domain-containing membrane protein YozV